jgi:multidrug resistance efflux pump
MIKLFIATGLIAATATIAMIDAQSTGLAEPAMPVDDSPRARGEIYALGIVEGRTEDIQLRPEQVGRATHVLVTPGQKVEADEVVVRLDDARQQQEVALAAADLELAQAELERLRNGARAEEREEAHALQRAAKARLEQAKRTWARIEQLRAQRAVSQQEADDQRALVDTLRAELEAATSRVNQIEAPARADEVRAATARVAAAEARLDLAKIGLSKTELRAPCRGRVLAVNIEPGELTGPEAVEPLVVICDTTVMRVRAFVEELDAPSMKIGMQACITADGIRDTTFCGRVVEVSPQMAEKAIDAGRPGELYDTKVREVLVELDAADQLIVGLRVDVNFKLDAFQEGKD